MVPVLLVSTATRWIGTARIPAALAHAGFTVSLLTPPNSVAERSRFVSRVGYLPENATVAQWVAAFAEIVAATQPRIVLPCDDMAFRLLANLRRSPPTTQPRSPRGCCRDRTRSAIPRRRLHRTRCRRLKDGVVSLAPSSTTRQPWISSAAWLS
jgi:hypothetical protein